MPAITLNRPYPRASMTAFWPPPPDLLLVIVVWVILSIAAVLGGQWHYHPGPMDVARHSDLRRLAMNQNQGRTSCYSSAS